MKERIRQRRLSSNRHYMHEQGFRQNRQLILGIAAKRSTLASPPMIATMADASAQDCLR
jgi:hypothetical protein